MNRGREDGFTIAEVLVAIVVLAVGVLGLVGTSALVTRMVGQGKRTTTATQVAARRVETLRQTAYGTSPRCTNLSAGTANAGGRITEQWTVSGTGRSRTVRAIVTYPTVRGTLTDTVVTVLYCGT